MGLVIDLNSPVSLVDAIALIREHGSAEPPTVGALRERIRRGSVGGGKDDANRWVVTPWDLVIAGYLPRDLPGEFAADVPDSPPADLHAAFAGGPNLVVDADRRAAQTDDRDTTSTANAEAADERGPESEEDGSQSPFGGEPGRLEQLYEAGDRLPFPAPPPAWSPTPQTGQEAERAEELGDDETKPGRRRRPSVAALAFGCVMVAAAIAVAVALGVGGGERSGSSATRTATVSATVSATRDNMAAAARRGDYATAITLADNLRDRAAHERYAAERATADRARRAAARKSAERRAAAKRAAARSKRAAARRAAAKRKRAIAKRERSSSSSSSSSAGATSKTTTTPANRAPAPQQQPSSPRPRGPAPSTCEFPPC